MYFPIDIAHGKSSVSLFPEPWASWGNQEERGRHPETNNNKSLLWSLRKREKRGLHCRLIGTGSTEKSAAKQQGRYYTEIQEAHSTCKHGRARRGSTVVRKRGMSFLLPFPSLLPVPSIDWAFWSQSSPKGSLPEASSWALVIIEHKGKLLTEPYRLSDA